MFDIGLSELVVIGVVALVVLGPERLPKVARTAGHLFGRLQRYVATVKADLNREMDMSELSKVKQEVQEAARAFEQGVQHHTQSVDAEARKLSASFETPAANTDAPATSLTQTQLLATQEQGLTKESDDDAPDKPLPLSAPDVARRVTPVADVPVRQATLDLGIEPARGSRS